MQGSRRIHVLLATAVALAAPAVLPALAAAQTLTPPEPASPGAEDTQTAYVVVGVLAVLVAAIVIGGLVAALRSGVPDAVEPERRTRGTSGVQRRVGALLAGLATIVFVFGIIVTESAQEVDATGADGLTTAQRDLSIPADVEPLEIDVTGQQWLWRYEYPDGTFSYYEMVVPVDTAIVLNLDSIDVQHSWWVPALGGMFDVVPGSPNTTWFKADETGSYEGRSTEFSGPGYPAMRARVTVLEPEEYEAWLAEQAQEIQVAQEAIQDSVAQDDAPAVSDSAGGDDPAEPGDPGARATEPGS